MGILRRYEGVIRGRGAVVLTLAPNSGQNGLGMRTCKRNLILAYPVFILSCLILTILTLVLSSCSTQGVRESFSNTFTPSDTKIMKFHVEQDLKDIEDLMHRLYLKNPVYEPDVKMRRQKADAVFRNGAIAGYDFFYLPSHKLLESAFAEKCLCGDRVFVLCLGLAKSIREAYDIGDMFFFTGVQVIPERLERLYINLSRTNWLLKTRRDRHGRLLFITNEAGENGYINMEYEKIFTRMLTRTADDIYLRAGLMNNFIFRSSTVFLSILTL